MNTATTRRPRTRRTPKKTNRRRSPGITLGHTESGEEVTMQDHDFDRHIHLVGSTGTGKSKVIEWFLRSLIHKGRMGFCLIDPHGSTYLAILRFLAEYYPSLAKRVLVFDPGWDRDETSFCYNPIPAGAQTRMDMVLPNLVGSTLKVFGQDNITETPRIARTLDNLYFTLIRNGLTLLEALPLIATSPQMDGPREKLLARVGDLLVREDLTFLRKASLRDRKQELEGVGNRLRPFLRADRVKRVIGAHSRSLDLRRLMDEGTILLVNLSGNGRLSFEHTKFLGTLLLTDFFHQAKLRDEHDPHLKKYYLVVDEFADFVTKDVARALEQVRKFGLRLVLAHQHMAQLKTDDEYVYSSVATNCRHKWIFGAMAMEDCMMMAEDLYAGHLQQKKIKDELDHQVVRQVEETRESHSRSGSNGSGTGTTDTTSQQSGSSTSTSQSQGSGSATSETTSTSTSAGTSTGTSSQESSGQSHSVSDTLSSTESVHSAKSRSTGQGQMESRSTTRMQGRSQSVTEGYSTTVSQSVTRGSSTSQSSGTSTGWSSGSSSGSSSSSTQSANSSIRVTPEGALVVSRNSSDSSGSGQQSSSSTGRSGSSSESSSTSQMQSVSEGRSESHQHSVSRGEHQATGHGQSTGTSSSVTEGVTEGHSRSDGQASSEGRTVSSGQSTGTSESTSTSTTDGHAGGTSTSTSQAEGVTTGSSHGEGESHGKSTTTSSNEGQGVTVSPFLKPEYHREVSNRTYWSLQELHYEAAATLKNLPTGTAVIRLDGQSPKTTRIAHVSSLGRYTNAAKRRVERFLDKVVATHPQQYISSQDLENEIRDRQLAVFGQVLSFEATPDENEPLALVAKTRSTPFG